MNRTHRILAATTLAVLMSAPLPVFAGGGGRVDVAGLGMAGTFVASSRGLDAVGINPANLAFADSGGPVFLLMPMSIHMGSDVMTYGLYREYFTGVQTDSGRVGRYLTPSDKQKILDAFPGGVGHVAGDAAVRPVGFSIPIAALGVFALTVTEEAAFFADVPKDYAQLILMGNTPGSVYDLAGTRAKASWTREYALSFATSLRPPPFLLTLQGGISLKYVQGLAYYELNRMNSSLVTGNDGILHGKIDVEATSASVDGLTGGGGTFSYFPAPAGTGWGLDIGARGGITDYMTVGLAVTDIGAIHWGRNVIVARTDSSFTIDDPLNADQRNAVERASRGTNGPGSPFTTSLPTTLRMGVAVEMTKLPFFKKMLFGEMTLAADYNQGFDDVPGSTTRGRVSLGAEYRPFTFLPLRAGVAFGGEDRFNLAFGLGFHSSVFDLDLASENLNWIFNTDSFSYVSLALGMKIKF